MSFPSPPTGLPSISLFLYMYIMSVQHLAAGVHLPDLVYYIYMCLLAAGMYYLSWGCFYATSSTVYGPFHYQAGCSAYNAHMHAFTCMYVNIFCTAHLYRHCCRAQKTLAADAHICI